MSLWKIAWRSIQQRGVPSVLTALSIGLGVALVVAVLVVHSVVDRSFRRGSQGYDLIVGAKGSPLQLVLNTVFHLGEPLEAIPYSYYRDFSEGRFVAGVETAIPVCMGHDYKGCRVVATVPEMFTDLTYLDGREYKFPEGRNFAAEAPFEAVAGSTAARQTGLKVGDAFRPTESIAGGNAEAKGDEHQAFEVVGILAPTGTPNDRALFINLEGFYRFDCHKTKPSFGEKLLAPAKTQEGETASGNGEKHEPTTEKPDTEHGGDHDADHDHDAAIPEEQRRLTAILVATDPRQPQVSMILPEVINREPVAQAVFPAREITNLFDGIVGNVQMLLLLLAVLVVVVAGIGILVSMYNSMNERRHEIAVMRALGASRFTVMGIILLESILLALGGGAVGLVIGHGLVGLLGPTIADQTGVVVSAVQFQLVELVLIPGLILLATLVGYLPAVAAYQTDVARALTTSP